MGELANLLAEPTRRKRGPRADLDVLLDRLDVVDASALRGVLADVVAWTDSAVAERLTAAGHPTTYMQVSHWRRTNGCR